MIVNILYSVPSFILFLMIAVIFVCITLVFTLIVNRRIDLNYRYRQNDAIVCISAIISVIYAILVGFTVFYELDTFDKAVQSEADEGRVVFSIYRDALLLPEPASSEIRKQVVDYAKIVVETEWPQMTQGKPIGNEAVVTLDNISNILSSLRKTNNLNSTQVSRLDELYTINNSLLDVHEERSAKINLSLIPGMWLVLLLGTFLTISMTTILGMERRLHLICVTAASLMVAAVIYLIITVDRPYRGDFSVQPSTLIATLKFISWQKNNDLSLPDMNYIQNMNDKSHKKKGHSHFMMP